MKIINVSLVSVSIYFASVISVFSQEEEKKVSFSAGADLVSTYVWRGVIIYGTSPFASATDGVLSFSPNFQPSLAMTAGNLKIGAWGSSDFSGGYKEVDLYAGYTAGPVTATVTDYNWTNQSPYFSRYFNYNNDASKGALTGHIVEASVAFNGTESLPLTVSVNTMLWGADKKYDKTLGAQDPKKQNYSTYIELGYAFKKFSAFVGTTPWDGFYGDYYGGVGGFAVVNMGISASKTLDFTEKFSLPVKTTFLVNPQAEAAHLIFALSF